MLYLNDYNKVSASITLSKKFSLIKLALGYNNYKQLDSIGMLMNEQKLFDFFKTHQIEYTLFKHQPLFTVEDQPILIDSDLETIPGLQSKNLFLKDHKGKLFLVSTTEDKPVDLKALSKILECGRFSFCKPEELMEYLQLTPGSVTPFGLIFDTTKKVSFVLDEDFLKADFVIFHPLRNDMNVTLTPQVFLNAMEKLEHPARIIRIPVKE